MAHLIGKGRYGKETYPTRSNTLGPVRTLALASTVIFTPYSMASPGADILIPEANISPDPAVPLHVDIADVRIGDVLVIDWQCPVYYAPGAAVSPSSYIAAVPVISTDGGSPIYFKESWQSQYSSDGTLTYINIGGSVVWTSTLNASTIRTMIQAYFETAAGVGSKITVGKTTELGTILTVTHLRGPGLTGNVYTLVNAPATVAPPFV